MTCFAPTSRSGSNGYAGWNEHVAAGIRPHVPGGKAWTSGMDYMGHAILELPLELSTSFSDVALYYERAAFTYLSGSC